MTSILTEIRQAVHRLAGSPGCSLGVFLTLTLGLALSVGMYTVLNGVILHGLPYPGGERVVEINGVNAAQHETDGGLTAAEAFALADAPGFEHTGWYVWGGETVLDGERPRELTSSNVSAGFFPALGVPPQLGRWLDAEDPGPESQAVILSDSEWERLTSRDPDVIGKPLKMLDETVTVVGVMPPEFAYPSKDVGLWRAVNPQWYLDRPASFANERYLIVIGRLVTGMDAERAELELDALAARLRDTYGLPDTGWRMRTTSLLDVTIGDVRGVLAGVFVISLVVLAIACANVGSLLAARLAARERELAIVQALGATSGRVWRGMLFELLLLAALASVVAVLVLLTGMGVFRAMSTGILPRAEEIALDPAVLAFAVLLSLLCPLLIALPFGLRLKKHMARNLQTSGKGTGDARRGVLHLLPVAGLALATASLIAGAAVMLSLDRLREVDPGFHPEDVYSVQVYHRGGADEWRRFARAVLARMSVEPDVESVALTTVSPLAQSGNFRIDVQVPGRDQPELRQAGDPEILVPFVQAPWVGMTFLARAPHAGGDLPTRMQKAIWTVDPQEAITRVSSLRDDLEAQLALVIFFTRNLGGFALLALSLAAFGTYSVIAFLQRRRTKEIGVRLALGAEPLAVARRVLMQGVTLAALAGVAGSFAAIAVLRLLGSQLFGVGAASPVVYALGMGGVLLAALLASVAPAWRAARVQPMAALRYE